MKKRFTLGELLLVLFCVVLLVALVTGAVSPRAAREAYCGDKLRNLLKVSHQYVTDHRGMWMAPCDLRRGAYVRCLYDGRYLKSSWKTLMTARETEITCPELPRVGHWKVMQGYGSVYNNGSSYDPQVGIYMYSPEYAFVGEGKARRPISLAKRVWFADSLNVLKPPFPSPLLFGHLPRYPKGAELFGAVNLTHAGRANIGAADGSVTAASPEEFKEYYMPVTGGNPLRHYSAPLRMYLDRQQVKTLKR